MKNSQIDLAKLWSAVCAFNSYIVSDPGLFLKENKHCDWIPWSQLAESLDSLN